MKKFILLGLIALTASLLGAAPTIDGSSGLIIMPTADSLKYKEFNIASDWLMSSDNNIQWQYRANIGAFGGIEMGFVGQNNREGVFINMKYYLISDNTKFPLRMAIGINNLTSYNQTDSYMVLSKRFNADVAGHFGFKVDLANGEANTSLMLGGEYFLSEKLAWIADLDGEQDQYLFNTGLRYFMNPNIMLSVNAINITNQASIEYPETMFSLGIMWTDFM